MRSNSSHIHSRQQEQAGAAVQHDLPGSICRRPGRHTRCGRSTSRSSTSQSQSPSSAAVIGAVISVPPCARSRRLTARARMAVTHLAGDSVEVGALCALAHATAHLIVWHQWLVVLLVLYFCLCRLCRLLSLNSIAILLHRALLSGLIPIALQIILGAFHR